MTNRQRSFPHHGSPVYGLLILLGLGVGAESAELQAQSRAAPGAAMLEASRLPGMRYRMIGPSRGGRVTTVAGIPTPPRGSRDRGGEGRARRPRPAPS